MAAGMASGELLERCLGFRGCDRLVALDGDAGYGLERTYRCRLGTGVGRHGWVATWREEVSMCGDALWEEEGIDSNL